jgi:hypothetical protein
MAHLFEAARLTSKKPLHAKFAGFLFHALWLIKGPGEDLGFWTGAEHDKEGRREDGGKSEKTQQPVINRPACLVQENRRPVVWIIQEP